MGYEPGWKHHRNAQPEGLGEKISGWAANTGKERRTRQNMASNAWQEEWESVKPARGGSTPAPAKREKLSWSQKRAADKVAPERRVKRGKK